MAEESTETTEEEQTSEETTETEAEPTEPKIDWKAEARKHERRAKKTAKELEAAQAKLAEASEADKSEQEKAVEQARKEAEAAAKAEAQAELRKERLSAAIARHAAGRFANVAHAEKLLDVDPDDIFDDEGKVQTDALKSALDQLLEDSPNLAATPGKPAGDADGGKGEPAKGDSTDPEAHFQAIRQK